MTMTIGAVLAWGIILGVSWFVAVFLFLLFALWWFGKGDR